MRQGAQPHGEADDALCAPFPGDVAWNFEKFLIAKDGSVAGRFRSPVKPDDPALLAAIDAELAK